MTHQADFPTTLQEAMVYFAAPTNGLNFMVSLRWADSKVICPHCQAERVSFLSTRSKWKCMACHKQFSAKVGTIFEDSALGYDKWFPAMWMIVNAKNGISSYEIHRALGVTQKTAWFMLQRIRLAMQTGSFDKQMSGTIEADETFVGGRAKNMHKSALPEGGHKLDKVAVAGLLQRTTDAQPSQVRVCSVTKVRKANLVPNILRNVAQGSSIYTDAFKSYRGLSLAYNHDFVDHAVTYARGKVHTNGMENFWSLLKRTLRGTYVSVDPVHLSRYLDEQAFRFNERKSDDAGRFLKVAQGVIGKGLTYIELMRGKGGEDLLPA